MEATTTDQLSVSELDQKNADRHVAKLGHAVAFLNNHLPRFGSQYFTRVDGDDWKEEATRAEMDAVPDDLVKPLQTALIAALGYVAANFTIPTAKEAP